MTQGGKKESHIQREERKGSRKREHGQKREKRVKKERRGSRKLSLPRVFSAK